jgi:hypothetical protein
VTIYEELIAARDGLREATEKLNAKIGELEDELFNRGVPPTGLVFIDPNVSNNDRLGWDGRHFFVQSRDLRCRPLVQCSRQTRVQACGVLKNLLAGSTWATLGGITPV